MDEDHLLAAFRYVAFNPVKAGLTAKRLIGLGRARERTSRDWTRPMTVRPPLSRIDDFAAFLSVDPGEDARWTKALKCELTGRPVGARRWVVDLAKSLGRTLSHETRGRKPRSLVAAEPALELYGN